MYSIDKTDYREITGHLDRGTTLKNVEAKEKRRKKGKKNKIAVFSLKTKK